MMRNKEIKNSERPWGKYFILDETPLYKIKRIEVDVNGDYHINIMRKDLKHG